jgi:uncharacterized short protein YbdD (DUF466 family)
MSRFFALLSVFKNRAALVLRLLAQTLRLMVGVGDYAVYVKHMQAHHPGMVLLDEKQWFRARVDARYGVSKDGSVKRCPC